ncbi:SulP family inorganic anion transporter [Paenarthrobacter sp. NPDC056912]|uniref:SulP family inorganic anion transporter n=1 Tax=Paenarthrobacter sp. NPDC056912 TaxID=3345965 RepID=UPI00366B19A4
MVRSLAGLTWQNATREVLAGVTLLAIAVPLNIGYAQIAGLPPTAGLYALVIPAIIYTLVVSSRQVVASPDAAAAALVASSVGGLAMAGSANYAAMATAQAIISGLLFVAAAVFKLGFLANFLSKPILVGFVGGLALDIMVSQLAKMLGVKIDSGGEFVEKIAGLVGGISGLNPWSLLISSAAVAILLVGRRLARTIPWALVVLVASTAVVVSTGLEEAGVSVLGPVDSGPPVLTWPVLDGGTWIALVPSAIALTLVTMAEGLLVARSYAEKNGYSTVPDRDVLAFGAANIAAGAGGSFAVGSSTSRTAAMDQSGSRTQLPTLVAATGTFLLLLFGTALLEHIPSPAIGAVVGVAILPLLGVRDFGMLWKRDHFEFAIGAACFIATLFIGAIPGILISFVLALINLAKRAANPPIDVLASDGSPQSSLVDTAQVGATTAPGVLVLRIAAPLFFANSAFFADTVKQTIADVRADEVKHLILDLEAVTDVDVTAAETFESLKLWLDDHHITLSFSRARPGIIDRMRGLGILANEAVHPTNRAALDAVADN